MIPLQREEIAFIGAVLVLIGAMLWSIAHHPAADHRELLHRGPAGELRAIETNAAPEDDWDTPGLVAQKAAEKAGAR